MNNLYLGDNLDLMRCHLKTETVDLVCLDPLLNYNANYNLLFQEQKEGGTSIVELLNVYLGLPCASLMTGGIRLCLS